MEQFASCAGISKTSEILPSFKDGLLRLFNGDLVSSGELRLISVGTFVIDGVIVIVVVGGGAVGTFVATLSSSAAHIAPRLSRHVGQSFTKREMSSFGTLQF